MVRKILNKGFKKYLNFQHRRVQRYIETPHPVQDAWLERLVQTAKYTQWGRTFGFKHIKNGDDFAKQVPVQDYESLKPYIKRMMYGEKDVLWSGAVKWYSKSSGTTSDKSKFIPVTSVNLKFCHIRGSWDTMSILYQNNPNARQFENKSLIMGGSLEPFQPYPKTKFGDVSAILIHHMPVVARPFYTPDVDTALMSNFEEKIERMARIVGQEKDLVMIGGVPTWTIVLFKRILELTGKQNMLEVWPNLQAYVHGGVNFEPYREQFKQFIPSSKFIYQEVYNASEGYFAIQNDPKEKDMLLLLDNGVYYEFLPMEEWGNENPETIQLKDVEIGKNYALVISTNSGLWRYLIGDTVTFTSTYPFKVKITGRTKQYINAFGEEVMVSNTDKALTLACEQTGAMVSDYTVAPIYLSGNQKGGHEWLVEFEKLPKNLNNFTNCLDQNLQHINSDYEAKRFKDMALEKLRLQAIPKGSFNKWLKMKGKLGGQHKVPRLSNNRKYVDDILSYIDANREIIK